MGPFLPGPVGVGLPRPKKARAFGQENPSAVLQGALLWSSGFVPFQRSAKALASSGALRRSAGFGVGPYIPLAAGSDGLRLTFFPHPLPSEQVRPSQKKFFFAYVKG